MKKNTTLLFIAVSSMIVFTGCSNKNLLMPGKSQSDCERDGGTYGMCGSPKNIYKYQSNIDNLNMSGEDAYHIDDNGNIQKIKEGKIINDGSTNNIDQKSSNSNISTGTTIIQNRNYMLSNQPRSSVIRNMEVIRRVWLNTYKDSNNNLVGEHDIYVVTKKADWTVGEKTPANIKKAKLVPSFVTKDAITESHKASDMKDDAIIKEYLK